MGRDEPPVHPDNYNAVSADSAHIQVEAEGNPQRLKRDHRIRERLLTGGLLLLPELQALSSIVDVAGLALAVYKTPGKSYGWVLAAACEVVAFDGWYPGDENLKPLSEALRGPDGLEEARILNNTQLGRGLDLSFNPLSESGLDMMPDRADDLNARGWGAAGLAGNEPFRQASIVAVAALGSASTLRWLADRI